MAPVTGAKPKPDDQRINRVKPRHDWVEVVDAPYEGERPALGRAPNATKAWWAVVSTMPHCSLWTAGDWQFALDTSRIHAAFVKGDMPRAQELRVREKVMGTTLDARRDLRIRYVETMDLSNAEPIDDSVADFEAERRKRLLDAG